MGDKVYEKLALFAGTVIYYTHNIIIFFFCISLSPILLMFYI